LVLNAAACTHPGRVRLNNEDMPVIDAARGIFGVIDGIGGQAGGEVAAATARDVILQRLARPAGTPAERVREAIAIANNEIYRRASASAELAGMGCVVTLAIVSDGRITIGHVGDTRLYKIRPEAIRKITRDHSPVGELEDAGELPEPKRCATRGATKYFATSARSIATRTNRNSWTSSRSRWSRTRRS
jgi:serine/threonine protein phosphatase PrpC